MCTNFVKKGDITISVYQNDSVDIPVFCVHSEQEQYANIVNYLNDTLLHFRA